MLRLMSTAWNKFTNNRLISDGRQANTATATRSTAPVALWRTPTSRSTEETLTSTTAKCGPLAPQLEQIYSRLLLTSLATPWVWATATFARRSWPLSTGATTPTTSWTAMTYWLFRWVQIDDWILPDFHLRFDRNHLILISDIHWFASIILVKGWVTYRWYFFFKKKSCMRNT